MKISFLRISLITLLGTIVSYNNDKEISAQITVYEITSIIVYKTWSQDVHPESAKSDYIIYLFY